MEYLHWAKVHTRVRYELTDSSVPQLKRHDLGISPADISVEADGAYGDPALIDAVARRYGVSPDRVVPVPGTSSANFIALAVACGRGGALLIEHPVYDPILRVADFLDLEVIRLPRHPGRMFGVDVEGIESGLRQGARAVVLSNLHNPSGQLLSREAVTRIAETCAKAGATLVVDEVYLDSAAITGGRSLWTAASIADNVIATGSLTKVYGLGGLRIGAGRRDAVRGGGCGSSGPPGRGQEVRGPRVDPGGSCQ